MSRVDCLSSHFVHGREKVKLKAGHGVLLKKPLLFNKCFGNYIPKRTFKVKMILKYFEKLILKKLLK